MIAPLASSFLNLKLFWRERKHATFHTFRSQREKRVPQGACSSEPFNLLMAEKPTRTKMKKETNGDASEKQGFPQIITLVHPEALYRDLQEYPVRSVPFIRMERGQGHVTPQDLQLCHWCEDPGLGSGSRECCKGENVIMVVYLRPPGSGRRELGGDTHPGAF